MQKFAPIAGAIGALSRRGGRLITTFLEKIDSSSGLRDHDYGNSLLGISIFHCLPELFRRRDASSIHVRDDVPRFDPLAFRQAARLYRSHDHTVNLSTRSRQRFGREGFGRNPEIFDPSSLAGLWRAKLSSETGPVSL